MKIIINADDFGFSKNINESIIYCHQKGCVTSTSLMATGKAFDEAVDLLKQNPTLGVGVHLVLDGQLNSLYQKSNLYNIYGNFHDQKFVTKALKKCKFNINDIMKEYSNQIEKVLKTGTKISHLDHHHHLHLYFQSLKAVIAVAKKYKIKYVRSQKIIMHHRRSISKMLYRLCHQFYTQMHLKTISGYYDLIHLTNNQFNLEKERLKQLLKRKKGIAEIIIHPKEKHDVETKFITDNEIIHLLKPQQLINYNDLI